MAMILWPQVLDQNTKIKTKINDNSFPYYFHENKNIISQSELYPWQILRNTNKRSRTFNQLLLTQNVQISIVFLSVKSIIMKIKEWHHVSLTSNISGKTWSNCKCRGCFENVRTSRFQIWPRFLKLTKIFGSNRANHNN